MNMDQLTLEEYHQRLELVVQSAGLGMWDWNPQTNEVSFNHGWANMLGYKLEEISSDLSEWEDRVHPDDLPLCYVDIQAHIDGKTDYYENVHRMRHKDGHWVHILDRGKITSYDADGKPIRFTGTHTDISKQKQAEMKAMQATAAKSRFLANMSHEIRTPLNGVLGVAQLLLATKLDAQQQSYVNVLLDSGQGLLTIINDILDYSKIEAGKLQVTAEPVDPREVIHYLHDLFQEHAARKTLRFEIDIDASVPECVIVDAHRLRQVLMNMLSNAFKFTAEGSITLSACATPLSQGNVEITFHVKDTGMGIANIESIWNSFEQDDASIAKRYGGTGLGLSICRSLIELMQGHIDVTSRVGYGSDFTIHLPVQVGKKYVQERTHHGGQQLDLSQIRVLVAEDNLVNQMVITHALKNFGIHAMLVATGAAAVEACEKNTFDMIFMDMHMPEMNGTDATIAIRNMKQIEQPQIYALTADALNEQMAHCLSIGMNGFISKPFSIQELSKTLQNICHSKT